MTKDKDRHASSFNHSSFLSSFVIRNSSLCWVSITMSNLRQLTNAAHKMIVSPRVGPTLTMESFAPASSEMNLTYFLAAEGSCENLRAVCMDVFHPATSS